MEFIFWIKHSTALQSRLAVQIQNTLDGEIILEWLVLGRTVLVMKNKDIGPISSCK